MDQQQDKQQGLLSQIIARYKGRKVTDARSAAGNWLAFTLEDIEHGKATLSLTVKREMTNPYGNIHGGMMALVMDETIGWAVVSLEAGQHYTSLNLAVDFLYAIREGDRLQATAEIIRAGKKIVHAVCTVCHAEDGTLLARGSSNLVVTGMKIR